MGKPLYPFPGWMPNTPVLPKLYWEAITPEQELHELCKRLKMLFEYATQLGIAFNNQDAIVQQLVEQFQKFIESGFDDYYKEQLLAWIDENFADLISAGVKQVYFGLTDDGYFCAYVPDSWSEISFDTGAVFGRSDYGRLILRFEADPAASRGTIDNTYNVGSYSLNAVAKKLREEIERLIADMEVNGKRTDYAYNTLFTNLDEVVSDGNF